VSDDPLAPWSRTNRLIIAAAERLGVEWAPLGSESSNFFMRLRWRERSVIISKTRSPFLTEVAQTLTNNKFLAREQLALHGLPIVPGLLLDDRRGPEHAREALRDWQELVAKPNWGNRGVGVIAGIRDFEQLEAAYDHVRAIDRDEEVLIEPFVPGSNLRVAVIGGRAVAAAEVRRPVLCGDGRRTIAELLAGLNDDPRRMDWRNPAMLVLDEIEPEMVEDRLEPEGLGLEDVLAAGRTIELSFEESEIVDRTDEVHPGWIAVAERAASLLGVDVAGVDLRGPMDELLEAPPSDRRLAGLLEVNALPALHLHELPTQGKPRPVFEAFVAYCLQLPGAPPPCADVKV
jgi:D-alanine-D-alanine ligase-like ATP-grasp enzyme